MYTVQDHPPSPNDSLLLPPLENLHKTHVRNPELPQPGDSRPVKSPESSLKDYVVLQKPLEQADRLPPPRTLILDFTLTHTRYGSSHVHTTGQMTNIRCSDTSPEFDGTLREVARTKILHYRQLYLNRPDPIAFLPAAADTTDRVYDDFSRLLFMHGHRETSALANEIPEESGQFRFLRAARYANIKGSVELILAKPSTMRISIPLDLSSRPFIP
jgi:hypothetical protein